MALEHSSGLQRHVALGLPETHGVFVLISLLGIFFGAFLQAVIDLGPLVFFLQLFYSVQSGSSGHA